MIIDYQINQSQKVDIFMPLVGDCCVNLSGRNVTVTDGNNRAIGELMNREFLPLSVPKVA